MEPWRRQSVRLRAHQLRTRLRDAGRETSGAHDGHIVPIVIGDAMRTMALAADLRRYDAVTPESVRQLAQQLLVPSQCAVVVTVPEP